MISIKKLLRPEKEDEVNLLPVWGSLLRGVGQHTIEFEPGSECQLRRWLHETADSLESLATAADFESQVEQAVRRMGAHNRRVSEHITSQRREFRDIFGMLARTIRNLSEASAAMNTQLNELDEQLGAATRISDLRALKTNLADCLSAIEQETAKHREAADHQAQELSKRIEKARALSHSGPVLDRDPITGLPARTAAESALVERCASETPGYVAIMTVDRLQAYNARFGRAVGDEILKQFAEMIQKTLLPGDALFRWSGPGVLAILERRTDLESVRSEIRRLMLRVPPYHIWQEYRSAILPIAARSGVFPTLPVVRLLIRKIDMLTAAHAIARGA